MKTKPQAARMPLHIIKDWIESQVAIIQAGQVQLKQVFLRFAQKSSGIILYEIIKRGGFKHIADD
jgi:hypothetical protein